MPDIAQHLATSHKVEIEDLDWREARRAGLSTRDRHIFQYFADIESQTVFYMLEVAKLDVARDPELLTFMTMWNYEEYFHAHAISRLLAECEVEVPASRASEVRRGAQLRAFVEDRIQIAISKLAPSAFVALWMAWGAAQELLTAYAYEEMIKTSSNPVARELCRRIAKQERRHFAYYYTAARERLTGTSWDRRLAQRLVRGVFEAAWSPVGSGVKSPTQAAAFLAELYPGQRLFEIFSAMDEKMAQVPGLEGLSVARRYAERIQARLPPEARVRPDPVTARIVDDELAETAA